MSYPVSRRRLMSWSMAFRLPELPGSESPTATSSLGLTAVGGVEPTLVLVVESEDLFVKVEDIELALSRRPGVRRIDGILGGLMANEEKLAHREGTIVGGLYGRGLHRAVLCLLWVGIVKCPHCTVRMAPHRRLQCESGQREQHVYTLLSPRGHEFQFPSPAVFTYLRGLYWHEDVPELPGLLACMWRYYCKCFLKRRRRSVNPRPQLLPLLEVYTMMEDTACNSPQPVGHCGRSSLSLRLRKNFRLVQSDSSALPFLDA